MESDQIQLLRHSGQLEVNVEDNGEPFKGP